MEISLASKHRLLLAGLILVWAVSWPAMKVGVQAMPPLWFGCIRYLIGGSLLFLILGVQRRLALPAIQDWSLVLVSGGLQMACFSALTSIALTILPPGRTAVLAYTTPLWVLPLASWRLDEPISSRQKLGVATGLAGITCLVWPSLHADQSQLTAYGMLLAAAALWAVSIVHVRGHRFLGSALALAPWQMLVAAMLLLPVAIATEGKLQAQNSNAILALAYVGPIATAFAYWAIVELGRHFKATTISMALLATPGLGIFFSAMTLGEAINASLMAGAIAIASGIWLATQIVTRDVPTNILPAISAAGATCRPAPDKSADAR